MQTPSNNYRHGVLRKVYENVKAREEAFKEFIGEVCKCNHVKAVFLAGSRARGDHVPSSDFDVVVVAENYDPIEVAEMVSSLRKRPVPVDIIVISEKDLEDPLYREMLRNAKRLC